MFAWIIRLVILFAVLTVIYVILSIYARRQRSNRLRAEYDADPIPDKPRDRHVAEGMARYDRSWSKRALLLVYLAPLALVGVLLAIANFT